MFKRKPTPAPVDRWPRPTSIAEARRQIAQTYRDNDWDEAEQMQFAMIVGLDAKTLSEYTPDEIRTIHARMVANRMILQTDEI